MNKLYIFRIINFYLRLNLFIFSYLLYLSQLIFIFLRLNNIAKKFFKSAAYFCSLSLGITYSINKNFKYLFQKKAIHISNHDNPLDIFAAQYLFGMRTITTVDQHLKKVLPFFEISLKNYGHFPFDYKNFNERKLAYLFLKKICTYEKNILIYPSGSIYTSIKKRFSKSVSKLSFISNLKIIAWRFDFDEVTIFDPKNYSSYDELHNELKKFY